MPAGDGAILVLNAGSSSLKLAVFGIPADGDVQVQLRGEVQSVNTKPHFTLADADGQPCVDRGLPASADDGYLETILAITRAHLGGCKLVAAGHRVVHGGAEHAGPARVTEALLRELDGLTPLAPLHQGHDLAPIRDLARLDPKLPQVACFDTAFHLTMPDSAGRFALPRALHDAGIRRYGMHGLSYQYVAEHLRALDPTLAAGRVVVAHLGSGASLCALEDGRSMDTTMGLTPLDGLVMATRCGALDPGVVLYLQQARGMSVVQVQDLLYHQSGLRGVSGISADMRDLVRNEQPAARQAVDLFLARLAKEIAGMAASLGGMDALVFTGGIGQHEAAIREAACERLRFLGIEIDIDDNRAGETRIETPASRSAVLVLPTDEEQVIARQTRQLLEL